MIGLEVDGKPLLRAYSMASSNHEDNLEFFSIKVADGPLTSRLQNIQVGDHVLVGRKPVGTLIQDSLLPGRILRILADTGLPAARLQLDITESALVADVEGARMVLSPLRDLFAAVFFVFFGLRTDPSEIPSMLLPALALAVITALTKVGVGIWAARRAKVAVAGQIRAGTAIVSRGEFNIVIAGLATGSGIIAPGFAALAAAYVLILAITGPLIARTGDPLGRRVARWSIQRRERKEQAKREQTAGDANGAVTENA
jgi:hypothetical protein